MRVVSLVPSATEILDAIGAIDLLVGRSHECDYPPQVADVPLLTSQRITAARSVDIDSQVRAMLDCDAHDADHAVDSCSLYALDADLLRELRPDVILTQDLCRVCSIDLNAVRSVASSLPKPPRIVTLNPTSLFDVFDDLLTVGEAVGRADDAELAMVKLRGRYWEAIDFVNPYVQGPEVAFLEWIDPLFAGGHWTPEIIHAAGGRHSLNAPGAVSRQITAEDLLASMPDRLIVCPCGFDLNRIRQELPVMGESRWWHLLPAVQDRQVALVDGNQMFNRPGPRLVDAMRWLTGWLNDLPELVPVDFPVEYLHDQ